jgi:uncharacterized protein involved in copper resistance
MTNDEIRELAQEAGFRWGYIKAEGLMDGMIDFAKLVAKYERKECEKIIWNADAWIGSDAKIWLVKSIQEERGQT